MILNVYRGPWTVDRGLLTVDYGLRIADCFVKAINLDPVTQDVYICDDFSGGSIYFEGMNGTILYEYG